jgi:glycosyltransferase involved in cell wall biosynthesis
VVVVGRGYATAAIARRAARRAASRERGAGGRVDVIVHERNRGVGAAITTGYARALELGAHATAVMAGDGQMDPADLPQLLAPVVAGEADYAKGNRFLWPGAWRAMPRVRLLGGAALSWLTRLASGYWHVGDSQCGYTVASRQTLLTIGSDLFPRYGYPNDLLTRLAAARARVVDVPVRPVYGPTWRSGLSPLRVMLPIAWLLLRGGWRRLRARWRGAPAPRPDETAGIAAPS